MKLGAMTNPRLGPVQQINWIGKHGFDFVELAVEPPAADIPDLDPTAIRAALSQHGMSIVVHTSPFLPIANPHQAAREMALNALLRSLDLAHTLGAHLITVHYLGSPDFFSQIDSYAHYSFLLSQLCDAASDTRVRIALENSPRNQGEVAIFREIFQRVTQVKLLLDVAHANINVSTNLTADFLRDQVVGERLTHVHVSENDGTRDLHLPLGSTRSAIDWRYVVNLLRQHGYDDTITLEVFSADIDYLITSRDKFRAQWNKAV